MTHFVRLFVNNKHQLSESEVPYNAILESQDNLVYEFQHAQALSRTQADDYADALSEYLLENGVEDFHIEISISEEEANALMERRIERQIAEHWKTKVHPILEAHPGTYYMGAYVYSKEAEQAIIEHKEFVEAKKKKRKKKKLTGRDKKGHKRATEKGAGLTKKGVRAYRRKNPGSKLQTAVTTKPSKLKKGSKAAKRRKSFCARSKGWKGERGKAARRRWNC